MQAVLLAGGKGTRLRPYTHVLPKPLMPLGDADPMPIIEVVLRQLGRFGFHDVTIITGYLDRARRSLLRRWPQVRHQNLVLSRARPLGTAGGLTLLERPREPVLVINGDILTTLDYGEMYSFHTGRSAAATIASYPREVKIDFGVLLLRRRSPRLDRIRREATVFVRGEHGRLHPRSPRVELPDAGPAPANARPAGIDAPRRPRYPLLPPGMLLARHRPPRRLRHRQRNLRIAPRRVSGQPHRQENEDRARPVNLQYQHLFRPLGAGRRRRIPGRIDSLRLPDRVLGARHRYPHRRFRQPGRDQRRSNPRLSLFLARPSRSTC